MTLLRTEAAQPEKQRPAASPYRIAIPLVAFVACGTLGVTFAPYLLVKQPLLLIGLSPLIRHMILASPSIDSLPFFTVAIARLFAPDPLLYLLGKHYGDRAVRFIEARSGPAGRVAHWLERVFVRAWVVAVFVSPGVTVCTLAGAARIPFGRFAFVNLCGTLTAVSLIRYVGAAFGDSIAGIVRLVEEYLGALTVASILLVFGGYYLWRRRSPAELMRLKALAQREGEPENVSERLD